METLQQCLQKNPIASEPNNPQQVVQVVSTTANSGIENLIQTPSDNLINEPRITPEEFHQVIRYAQILQQAELANRQTRQKESEALSHYQGGIPLSLVQKVITDVMDIGKPYVKKALQVYFPTREQMQSDIQLQNAKPSTELLKRVYLREIEKSFEQKFPGKKFKRKSFYDFSDFIVEYYELIETEKIRNLGLFKLKKRRVIEDKLAELSFSRDVPPYPVEIKIKLHRPLFLQACGASLDALNRKYGGGTQVSTRHDYSVD